MENALDQSNTCAVFLGPNGIGGWENEEMRSALDTRVHTPAFRVIPVLLPGSIMPESMALPRFLRRLGWVDFRSGLDDAQTFYRLICGIKGIAPGAHSAVKLPNATGPSPERVDPPQFQPIGSAPARRELMPHII